ncbi:MAG TPA: ribulokinase [Gaiellaceae bacterium]|nr:ribulokinase [Gaiellaceae bacterium]
MKAALGIDFGTESARALLVDVADGRELATAVHAYDHGVIDERLPGDGVALADDWALQDPDDYLRAVQGAVPRALAASGVRPEDVVGVGIDFTSCTMLPTLRDGTPLCKLPSLRRHPHAWVKLWKHHAAQPEADRINALAAERDEPWLARYGGKISSEWFFPKALQILDEAPAVYERAERLLEACDWVVWQLTGVESRNACAAGYKAMWSKRDGFPPSSYFAALDRRFEQVVDEKMSTRLLPPGARAGALSEAAASWTTLLPGTPVAAANLDFHASVPAATVTQPGTLVMIMGTSNGLMLLGDELVDVEGMCGVVEDGVLPGLFGYEAGQSGLGDVFGWFVRGFGESHDALAAKAATLRPGESGLLALDWLNGNRSVLVDAELSGLVVGLTLATTPAEIYRALLEATAFGTRVVVDGFERAGLPVERIVACGGVPDRNPLLMQIFADVTGRTISVAGSAQTPALGAAMWGAVAGGAFSTITLAAEQMAHLRDTVYRPSGGRGAYDALYAEYLRLHDLFGRGGDDAMRNLRRLRAAVADVS